MISLKGLFVTAALVAAFLLVGANARAGENCQPIETVLSGLERNSGSHVILKDESAKALISRLKQLGAPVANENPDFIMIAVVPSAGIGAVLYGEGEMVCDALVAPMNAILMLLRSA